MKKLEVYYDYLCPYCYRGHQYLLPLAEKYPGLEIVWRPCEANPRPEVADVHSDLAIAGLYYLQDIGGDTDAYNELIYAARYDHGQRLDDLFVLGGLAEMCGADRDDFEQAIQSEAYAERVRKANEYAWNTLGWSAVPSYVCGGRGIGSEPGVLVTFEELDEFLSQAE